MNLHAPGTLVGLFGRWFGSPVEYDPLFDASATGSSTMTDQGPKDGLSASETQIRAILENIPHMIFVKDATDLRFVRFNKAGEALLGYSRDELIGKNDYDFFPDDEADFFTSKDREVLAGDTVVDIPEEPIDTRHNGRRVLHTKKIPLRDESGAPMYLLGISEDITDRKAAEERLRAAEAQQRALIRAIPDSMLRVSRDATILDDHPADASLTDPGPSRVGRTIDEVFPESFCERCRETISDVLDGREAPPWRYENDGASFEVRVVSSGADEVVVILRDISKQADAERLRTRFVEEVLSAQENERRRIARDLHDGTSQSLASIATACASIEHAPSLEVAVQRALKIGGIAMRAIDTVNRLAHGLHPQILDDLGFVEALRSYAAEFGERYELHVDVLFIGLDEATELPRAIATTSYRIIQEGLTNVMKHAQATSVSVVVSRDPTEMRLQIEDNGVGFNQRLVKSSRTGGLGLYGIQERAALFDGRVTIDSKQGKGTTISVKLPLNS